MMETTDLQQLRDLLNTWKSMFPVRSDAAMYCATVLIDVDKELRMRRRQEAAATH